MVRVLKHFGLSRPCSAPLQLVAHRQAHTQMVLRGIFRAHMLDGEDPRIFVAQGHELYQQLLLGVPSALDLALKYPLSFHFSAELQGVAEGKASAAIPRLRAEFGDLQLLQQLGTEPY